MGRDIHFKFDIQFKADSQEVVSIKIRIKTAATKEDFPLVARLSRQLDAISGRRYHRVFLQALAEQAEIHPDDLSSEYGYGGRWGDYEADIEAVIATGKYPAIEVVVECLDEEGDRWRHKFTTDGNEKIHPTLLWPDFKI